MPPELNGTGEVPTTVPAAPAQPAAPVVPVAAPQPLPTPPPALEVPPTSTDVSAQDPTADFERKFNSQRGTIKERQRQWDEYQGVMETRLKAAESMVRVQEAQLVEMRATTQRLTEQLSGVPVLRESANKVPVLQEQMDKLKFAMQFPTLIEQAKVVEVTNDAGEITQVRQNTVLDMLLSSSVQGENWQRMAEELAVTLTRESPVGLPASRPLGMTLPGGPPQPIGGGDSIEELKAQMRTAYQTGNYQQVDEITSAIAKAHMRTE